MSLLTAAAAAPAKQQTGPQHFTALRPPVITAGSSYQLVKRDSDSIAHTLAAVGKHTGASMLDALNAGKVIAHQRAALKDDDSAAADAQREQLKARADGLLKVTCDRADRTASMFVAYGEQGVE